MVIRITTPARHREALERDLADEIERVRRERGRAAASRFLVRELAWLVAHGLRDRFSGGLFRPAQATRRHASERDDHPAFHSFNTSEGMMENLVQDLRYSLRSFAKSPGFTAVTVFTLALGIGATTAIFSVVQAVLLRTLPYDAPERIVQVWNPWSNEPGVSRGRSPISIGDFADVREEIGSFEEMAVYARPSSANLTGGDQPERILLTRATAGVFDVLGTEAVLGRTFTAEEDAPGGSDVVVLSHELWQRRFGGDPSVIGSTVQIDGLSRQVVGVTPPSFRLPADYTTGRATEIWAPLGLDLQDLDRGSQWLYGLARLTPDATVEGANAELGVLTRRWIEQRIVISDLPPYYAVTVEEEIVGSVRPALLVLFGAVAFVLLIACVNVTNLLLARADGRRTEMAVRTALGAGRGRIVRQLLTESLLLALFGGVLGVLVAYVGIEALVALDPAKVPRIQEVGIDGRALGVAGLASVLSAVLFGFVPALRASRPSLVGELRADGRGATGGRGRRSFRSALVAAEVASSVVLVIGAGLMIRTFAELSRIDLGFDPEDVLTLEVSLPTAEYPNPEDRVGFHTGLVERLRSLPGVRAGGAAGVLPLTRPIGGGSLQVEGAPRPPAGQPWPNARFQAVVPGYFEAMGHRIVSGRLLEPEDRVDGVPTVVVNETMARALWPERDPIGMRVRNTNTDVPWFTVVGVVEDVRHAGVTETPSPMMYIPLEQLPLMRSFTPTVMSYAVSTASSPEAMVPSVREVVRSLDPNLPVAQVRTMEEIVGDALARARFTVILLGTFAAVALALAVVGIYGVLSQAVTRRRREIGIRMALGAARTSVLTLVIGNGMRLALSGMVVGVVAGFFLTRLMQSLLYGVDALDPVTFLTVPALFALVALVASYLPARRAVAVDPLVAMRHE